MLRSFIAGIVGVSNFQPMHASFQVTLARETGPRIHSGLNLTECHRPCVMKSTESAGRISNAAKCILHPAVPHSASSRIVMLAERLYNYTQVSVTVQLYTNLSDCWHSRLGPLPVGA